MSKFKKYISVLILLCLLVSISACSKKPQKPSSKSENEPPEMPKVIEEIESDALSIMEQADMIPYFQRVIVEQQAIEEKKKAEELQMKLAEGAAPSEEGKKEEEKKGEEAKGEEKSEEEKPQPMTIKEGILTELMKREKNNSQDKSSEKPPKDIAEVWKKINGKILGLHDKWNVLEPLLMQQSVSMDTITSFETSLNNLTKFGLDNKYLETLGEANKLTSYLPDFMVYFKKKVPPALYTLKYNVRNAVINAAVGNYPAAQESVNKLKEQGQMLKTQLIENKGKNASEKYDVSVVNLQKSLDEKNLALIKINASIVLKNIMLMEETLSGSL